MARFRDFLANIDKYVGPIYRVIFITSALIAIVSWAVYQFLPYATQAYNWIDTRITDVGPALSAPSPQTRILISLVFGLVGGLLSIFAKLMSIQQLRLRITDEISRCTASHIKYYDELFTIITSDQYDNNETRMEMISEISRNHSIFLCSRLAEIFSLVTNSPCHTSIKSFNTVTGQVTTRTRDALMHNHDRSITDDNVRSFPYEANTAFKVILNNPKVDIYVNNFLRFSAALGYYSNANPDWQSNYCATVVAPISSSRSPAAITRDSVIGFVCVDNQRGAFPSRYSRAVLSVFVLFINDMMVKLGEIEQV